MEQNKANNNLEALRKVLESIKDCDSQTLSAALAMLPDIRQDGDAIIIAAATRVVAERFQDTEHVLTTFCKLVKEHKRVIAENESVS